MSPINDKGALGGQIATLTKSFRDSHVELLALYEQVNILAHEVQRVAKPHNNDARELLVALLYIRILSSYQAVFLLATSGMKYEVQVILRTMMEAVFKICGVINDQHLHRRLIYNGVRFVRDFATKQFEPGLTGPHLIVDPEKLRQRLSKLEADLEASGIQQKIKINKVAKIAGLTGIYENGYSYLSLSVHHDVYSLEEQLDRDGEGVVKTLNWGPQFDEMPSLLITSLELIFLTTSNVAEFFGIKRSEVDSLFEKYAAIKSTYGR